MKIILLSGGSGKRLWPLSNEARSKQFLKLLNAPDGTFESMTQRIVRQVIASKIDADITVATSINQYDSIVGQLGDLVDVVTEPDRRDTFPAIALSVSYLLKEKGCSPDEIVVVMPSDSYVEPAYFETVSKMAELALDPSVDMVLMGIPPSEASTNYGYVVPETIKENDKIVVKRFREKPNEQTAEELIAEGAFWNAGVFAFRLGYVADIVDQCFMTDSFGELRENYDKLAKISFDYQVVERAKSIALVPYHGAWTDLGTWDSLSKKMPKKIIGNVSVDVKTENTTIINELDLPLICLGAKNLIVAASPDGILVSHKDESVNLKSYADSLHSRPMYEERRWGTYKVMGCEHFEDGHKALTKLLYLNAGCNISYQYHNKREEIWTFVDGKGLLILDGEQIEVSRGYVAHIKQGVKHAVRAITDLQIIEVQTGDELVEQDIVRLDWNFG